MKKFAILAGCIVVGLVVAQGSGALGGHAKALADAQGLSATFTYQWIGGSPATYKIDLAKPGMAKIDRGNELIVADGTSITILDRKANTYYKVPQTSNDLAKYFAEDELALFAPFFNAKAFDKFAKVTSAGTKNRKGVAMNVVEAQVDAKGLKKATYYIDPATSLARQVEYMLSDGPEPVRVLVDTKEFVLSTETNADRFAFKAPEGSRELSLEEMNSDKWYTNLDEAKEVAKKTKRLLFVDFYADW
jgi:outer membrane lipoprotein-sorting protein